jgi:hypothetical protein
MLQFKDRMKSWLKPDYAWGVLVVMGILLRLRQYLANRSLWADEASLAFNLANRTFGELTHKLYYHQAAPIGFLLIEKFSIVMLGNRDYIMRIFPLFSGVLATYLIYRIARATIGMAGMFAVAMFSFSWWLIYYSSELKQYSSDVMIALLLVYLSVRCLKDKAQVKDFFLLGLAGMIGLWVSHPAVFVIAGIASVLLFEKITRKDYAPMAWIAGVAIVWAAFFLLEYLVSLRQIISDEFLINYWQKGYMPIPPWGNPGWFINTFYSFLFISLNRTDKIISLIFLVLAFVGSLSSFVRSRNVALLIMLPFIITLAASTLHRYPLVYRFMLFLVPFAFLLMAEGLRWIYAFITKWNHRLALAICVSGGLATFLLIASYTLTNFIKPNGDDIRLVLKYVSENRAQQDIVYVFHGADPAFSYYAPFYGLTTGDIRIGNDTTRKKPALQHFYEDVNELKGNSRVWFIFSDIVDCGGCVGNMQAFYVDYINNFGSMLDSYRAPGANAYLFNLNP